MCQIWGLKLSPKETLEFIRFFRPADELKRDAISYASFCEGATGTSYARFADRIEPTLEKDQTSMFKLSTGISQYESDSRYLSILFLSIIQSMALKFGSLRRCFEKLDSDGNGYVTPGEVYKELHNEQGIPKDLVAKVIQLLSGSSDAEVYNPNIFWAEFLNKFREAVLAVRFKRPDESVEKAEISILDLCKNDATKAKDIFTAMDKDGSGDLDVDEFRTALRELGLVSDGSESRVGISSGN